jgi:hypothetical protein
LYKSPLPSAAGQAAPPQTPGLNHVSFGLIFHEGKRLILVCLNRGLGEVRNMRQERGFEKYVTPVVVIVVMGMLAVILWQFVVA